MPKVSRWDPVERLCAWLGRRTVFSGFLDWVSGFLIPPVRQPAWDTGAGLREQISRPMKMATGPDLGFTDGNTVRDAPATPHDTNSAQCAAERYRGMHGRPCAYAGATDLKCPSGTKAGWFWRYKTPVGIYYYVDCCGRTVSSGVWCNWTNEANWCIAAGSDHGVAARAAASDRRWEKYTCTLAIPDKDMKTVKVTDLFQVQNTGP